MLLSHITKSYMISANENVLNRSLKIPFPSINNKKNLLYSRFICYCLLFPSPWRLCVTLLPFRGTKLEQVLYVPVFFQRLKKSVHEPPQENPVKKKKKHTTVYQSPHTSIFICTFFNIVFAEAGPKGGMTWKSSLKYWTSQRITQNIQYWYSKEGSGNIQNKEGKRARVIDRERGGGHQLKNSISWSEWRAVGSFISEKEKWN